MKSFAAFLLVALLSVSATAQVTTRESVASDGSEGDIGGRNADLTPGTRYLVFESASSSLDPTDTNGFYDIYLRDRWDGTTTRLSQGLNGAVPNQNSTEPRITRDARFVVFTSFATNLVAGDTNNSRDVFLLDRMTGSLEIASLTHTGSVNGGGTSTRGSVSEDGRFVAFSSYASDLVPGDTNTEQDVFRRDRVNGTTVRVNVAVDGTQANATSLIGDMSQDGRWITFVSSGTNLIPGDTNNQMDIFLKDMDTGDIVRISEKSNGTGGNGLSRLPTVSGDGSRVAFESAATNLVAGDTNNRNDIFVRDLLAGTLTQVPSPSGSPFTIHTTSPHFSIDGRALAFSAHITKYGLERPYAHELDTGATRKVSLDSNGVPSDGFVACGDSVSGAEGFVAFTSSSPDLVPGDTNTVVDVFLRGPEVALDVSPYRVTAGDTVEFRAWTGLPFSTFGVFTRTVNGVPFVARVLPGRFDASGRWTVSLTVPGGLAGTSVSMILTGYGATQGGVISNEAELTLE